MRAASAWQRGTIIGFARETVTVHGPAGDWSIFRSIDVIFRQDVGRKHGPVPLPARAGATKGDSPIFTAKCPIDSGKPTPPRKSGQSPRERIRRSQVSPRVVSCLPRRRTTRSWPRGRLVQFDLVLALPAPLYPPKVPDARIRTQNRFKVAQTSDHTGRHAGGCFWSLCGDLDVGCL